MARGKNAPPGGGSKRKIEQYDHRKAQRKNNPPVGLVTEATDRDTSRKQYQYDPHLDPTLTWAGKAEHTSFGVPTVSLHVHERIDPKTIIEAVRGYRPNTTVPFEYLGTVYHPGSDANWKTTVDGLKRLASSQRCCLERSRFRISASLMTFLWLQ